MATKSSIGQRAYQERLRLGLEILKSLVRNNQVEESTVPDNVFIMLGTWDQLSAGAKIPQLDTRLVKLMPLLAKIPSSCSDALCPNRVVTTVHKSGRSLVENGFIHIFPTKDNSWSYKRTPYGDRFITEFLDKDTHHNVNETQTDD